MKRRDSQKPKNKRINPHKPKKDFKGYLKFVGIALVMVFILDTYVFKGERPYITKMKADYYAEQSEKDKREAAAIEAALPPKVVYPEASPEQGWVQYPDNSFSADENFKGMSFSDPLKKLNDGEVEKQEVQEIKEPVKKVEEPVVKLEPPIKKTNKSAINKGGRPKIAIVIDDVGMNIKQSHAAIELDPDVTVAFLPYAESVRALAEKAKANGNEMIIHTPMEAMSSDVPLGSMALYSDMVGNSFAAEFNKMAGSFDGYVGINNHMGSKLTQDPAAMAQLMGELKKRNLFFLDSRTIHTSIAAEMAAQNNVPFAVRDVFLDHEETNEFTDEALQKVERIARAHGQAIAIGHPKNITMSALKAWIPTLGQKGFELVPVSRLMNKPAQPAIQIVQEESVVAPQKIEPAAGENIVNSSDAVQIEWHSPRLE